MRKLLLIVIFLAANVSTCFLLSCLQGYEADIYSCPDPVLDHLDSLGQFDPCCRDKSKPCREVDTRPLPLDCKTLCLQDGPPPDWSRDPVLLRYGPSSEVGWMQSVPMGRRA